MRRWGLRRFVRLTFRLETDATADELETLLKLTERYYVIYVISQTLRPGPELSAGLEVA